MNFKDNKPIYLQIAEHICDEVLAGVYQTDQRIPSVREFAASVEVNANTVARSYDYLQQSGIIYNKRGLGFFVAEGAERIITDMRREQILGDELHQVFSRMATIGISPDELHRLYTEYLKQQ